MNKVKYDTTLINNRDQAMGQEFNETVVNAVAHQGPKIIGVWGIIGISSWSEAAAFLAFVLSALALTEYLWKKLIRPLCVHWKWLPESKKRVKLVEVESDD